jgi:hypothetical protein
MEKSHRPNLFKGFRSREFWLWADLDEPLVREGLAGSGRFVSACEVGTQQVVLPFIENPGFLGPLSPFGLNVVREYQAEYRLELARLRRVLEYPSRLSAIFLLNTEDDAWRYAEFHAQQTRSRQLLRAWCEGTCHYSEHDSRWIDVLRAADLPHAARNEMAHGYWQGDPVPSEVLARARLPRGPHGPSEVLFVGEIRVSLGERR